ncbi:MAG: hypothetical protein ABIL20_09300, partial [candidate division WOR-3 bacterium]
NIGYARRFGLFGICIKNFQTRVDTILFTGVVGGIGSYITLNKLAIGAKIDNIGAELIHRVDVPAMMGIALRYSLLDDFKIFAEIRGKNFEISSGLLYKYEMLQIFAGAKYIRPEEYIERSSFSDCWFSGGVVVGFDEYEIGYSFVYTEFSNAHQIGIKLTPDLSSKKLF